MPREFGNDNNRVSSTVADTWTAFGSAPWNGAFLFQAVYCDLSTTQDLKIRDAYGKEIYHFVSEGAEVIDPLPTPFTVKGPLMYLTDEAGKEIIIYGSVD